MAKGKILKSLVKKKPSGIKKSTPRYVKTASGMKLNPERFKQKPLPKTKKQKTLKSEIDRVTPAYIGAAVGAGATYGVQKMRDKKTKKTKQTKQMADEAYKKQKKRQKEYRQGKGGKGNRQ